MVRPALLVALSLVISAVAGARSADEAALLEIHETARRAHLQGDAAMLTASMDEHIWDSGRGELRFKTRAEMAQQFSQYFHEVKYSRWDNVQPPHVFVSRDGSQAWMAVQIEAQLTKLATRAELRFRSSWIAVYEKRNGRWLMVGIASSVVDQK
jgi:SnoaL-like domain